MTTQQLKNINKTDKHIHTHKKRYLEVIRRSTRFKKFNREKKTATKTSNMFKIVPRIETCDTGFFHGPIEFEITRVNCVWNIVALNIIALTLIKSVKYGIFF